MTSPTVVRPSTKAGPSTTQAMALGCMAIALAVLVLSGVSWSSSILLILVVALQGLAGAMTWKALDRRAGPLMVVGMGLAIGTAMSALSGLVVVTLGLGEWGWAIPSVVAIVLTGWRAVRTGTWRPRTTPGAVDLAQWSALAVAAFLGLGSLASNLLNYPLAWEGTWSRYHSDMPFFEALATSMARLGPLDSIFLSGGQVRYHYLAYAWAGQVTEAAGAAPFVVMTRVVPLVAILAGSTLIIAWTRRMTSIPWAPSLSVVLFIVGGFLGAVYGGVLNADSPSQSVSVMWLLAFTLVFLKILVVEGTVREDRVGWALAVLALMAFCVLGGKVSAAAPALAGICLVGLVGLIRREAWRLRALAAIATSLVLSGLAFVLLVSGASGGGGLTIGSWVDRSSSQQGLNPLQDVHGVMAGTAILMIAIAARWAGVLWLFAMPRMRWAPATILGFGMGLASLGAVAAFNSFNEIWFSVAASGPLAALTAVGAAEACEYLGDGRPRARNRIAVTAAIAAAIIYVVVWLLWATGASGGNVWTSTLRWTGPLVGVALAVIFGVIVALRAPRATTALTVVAASIAVLVFATAPGRLLGVGTGQVGTQQPGLRNDWFSVGTAVLVRNRDRKVVTEWTTGLMDAAAWLRSHANRDDLLATNLTFGPFVPGVTGLQTYVSAMQYQGPYGRPPDTQVLLKRENEVWDFIDSPSASTAQPLCDAGVEWLWVDPSNTEVRDWAPYATVAFANDDAIILRWDASACG